MTPFFISFFLIFLITTHRASINNLTQDRPVQEEKRDYTGRSCVVSLSFSWGNKTDGRQLGYSHTNISIRCGDIGVGTGLSAHADLPAQAGALVRF